MTFDDPQAPAPVPVPAPFPVEAANPFDGGQIAAAIRAANTAHTPAQTPAPAAAAAAAAADPMAALESFGAVNLDEVVIEEITVPFIEWGQAEGAPEDAPLRPRIVRKTIQNFVPMLVFNKSLRLFQLMQSAKDEEERMAMIGSAVLLVWQLSDPSMTLERLMMGLDFVVIMKLFYDFFGAKLRLIGLRVGPGASSINGRG